MIHTLPSQYQVFRTMKLESGTIVYQHYITLSYLLQRAMKVEQ